MCKASKILAAIGAINWGLVGLFSFNLVTTLLGEDSVLTTIVYAIVGVAGVLLLIGVFKCGKSCKS